MSLASDQSLSSSTPAAGSALKKTPGQALNHASKRLLLDGVSKSFGGVMALQPMTLDVRPGELLALLGPSGCGKTTTLRLIAGFDTPDTGAVHIGGRDVTGMPPNKRGLGMVFQNYSLFPHLNVGANIGFGLKMAGVDKATIAARVQKMLEMIRLPEMGGRAISQLSGGQQQRIALARALITNPSVLLLDEPLGALDKNLREGMQFELRQLQSELGITSVMVTHDQEEALTMSDRVVVMDRGRILQVGPPDEVYDRPRSRFVAEFLGTANIVECDVIDRYIDALKLRPYGAGAGSGSGEVAIIVPWHDASNNGAIPKKVSFAIRPEKIVIDAPLAHHQQFAGRIVQHVFRGAHHAYRIEVAALGLTLIAYELAQHSRSNATADVADVSTAGRFGGARPVGADVVVSFASDNAVMLDVASDTEHAADLPSRDRSADDDIRPSPLNAAGAV